MERITSAQNPAVKLARSLRLRKNRDDTGLFQAEGSTVLEVAMSADWPLHTLFLREASDEGRWCDWAARHGARTVELKASLMTDVTGQDNPPAAAAILKQQLSMPPSSPAAGADWIVLEGIRDPGNLGTIIRTTDAAGAAGVLLVGNACDPFSRDAVHASMGSIFAVPVARMDGDGLALLAAHWPGDVVATAMTAGEDFRSTYRRPALILMGSEGSGLSPSLSALGTRQVRIPMAGRAESLNVAAAAALMLYEVRRGDLK